MNIIGSHIALSISSPTGNPSLNPSDAQLAEDARASERATLLATIEHIKSSLARCNRQSKLWESALEEAHDALDDFDMEQSIAKQRSLDNALEARLERQ